MSPQQACLTLCLAALAVAAPQQDLGDLRSVEITRDGVDREKVVSQVVAALTPQIQTAVAQALAALQTQAPKFSREKTNSVSNNPGAGLSSAAGPGLSPIKGISTDVGAGLSSNGVPELSSNVTPGKASTTSALSSSQPGSQTLVPGGGASQSAKEAPSKLDTSLINNAQSLTGHMFGPTAKPVYNFEYKVSSDADQTYLSQNEERDGDQLTGSYKYVNPLGALITVSYQAGPEGFSQTIDQQDGFIMIRPNPSLTSVPSSPSLVSAKSNSNKSKILLAGSKLSSNTQSGSSGSDTSVNSSESNAAGSEDIVSSSEGDASESSSIATPSSTFNQQELINTIIYSLKPEIAAAVKTAIENSKADNPVLSRPADAKTKKTLKDASAFKLNTIQQAGGKLDSRLPEGKGISSEISDNFTPGISGRYAGTVSPISTKSEQSPGVDRDMLSKFGSGLFVKIKTPNSDISY